MYEGVLMVPWFAPNVCECIPVPRRMPLNIVVLAPLPLPAIANKICRRSAKAVMWNLYLRVSPSPPTANFESRIGSLPG